MSEIRDDVNSKIAELNGEKPIYFFTVFYAHWCSHCQYYAPKYSEMAESYSSKNILFYAIDCAESHNTCGAEKISAYPTVKEMVRVRGDFANELTVIDKKKFPDRLAEVAQNYSPFLASIDSNSVDAISSTHSSRKILRSNIELSLGGNNLRIFDGMLSLCLLLLSHILEDTHGEIQKSTVDMVGRLPYVGLFAEARLRMASTTFTENRQNALRSKRTVSRIFVELVHKFLDTNISISDREALVIVENFEEFLLSCDGNGKVTCGIWRWIHWTGSQLDTLAVTSGDTLRGVQSVAEFILATFKCEDCVGHFRKFLEVCPIGGYFNEKSQGTDGVPAAEFFSCVDDSVFSNLVIFGKGRHASLWFWWLHYNVDARLGKAEYPSHAACPLCFISDSSLVTSGLSDYLNRIYAREDADPTDLSNGYRFVDNRGVIFWISGIVVSLFVGYLIFMAKSHKKLKI